MKEYNDILARIKEVYDKTNDKLVGTKLNLEKINGEIKPIEEEIPTLEYELDILENPKGTGKLIAKRHHFWSKLLLIVGTQFLEIVAFFFLISFLKDPSLILKSFGLIGTGAFTFLFISEAIDLVKLHKKMTTDYILALNVLKNENFDDLSKVYEQKINKLQELEKEKEISEDLIKTLPMDLENYAQSYNTIALKMANEPTMITYCKDKDMTIFQDMRKERVLKNSNKES